MALTSVNASRKKVALICTIFFKNFKSKSPRKMLKTYESLKFLALKIYDSLEFTAIMNKI